MLLIFQKGKTNVGKTIKSYDRKMRDKSMGIECHQKMFTVAQKKL